jgi:hypothetical protein
MIRYYEATTIFHVSLPMKSFRTLEVIPFPLNSEGRDSARQTLCERRLVFVNRTVDAFAAPHGLE